MDVELSKQCKRHDIRHREVHFHHKLAVFADRLGTKQNAVADKEPRNKTRQHKGKAGNSINIAAGPQTHIKGEPVNKQRKEGLDQRPASAQKRTLVILFQLCPRQHDNLLGIVPVLLKNTEQRKCLPYKNSQR